MNERSDEEKATARLFAMLFNQLDVHDQITILKYMDDLDQLRQRREAAVVNIQDFMDRGKETQ